LEKMETFSSLASDEITDLWVNSATSVE
jgi:hypothetical protein